MVDDKYIKIKEHHHVKACGLLITIRINDDGICEIIGFNLVYSKSQSSCVEFFSVFESRELKMPRYIASYNHNKG